MFRIPYLIEAKIMIYQLDQLQLLGQGGYKIVYQHPTEHDKAIKIMGGVSKSMLVNSVNREIENK